MKNLKGKGTFIVKTDKGKIVIALDNLEIEYNFERNYFFHEYGSESWTDIEDIKLNDGDIEMKFEEKIKENDFDFWENEFDTKNIEIIDWELWGEIEVD